MSLEVVLFENDDVVVYGVNHESAQAVITFASLNIHDQPFGRALFDGDGITGVYFVAKWNHWYQPEGCRHALGPVRDFLDKVGATRRMTYGSSMGGYAAALFSSRLNADRVLMLAPQFAVDPTKPPHEKRWLLEAANITVADDDMAHSASPSAAKFLVFDPYEDVAHATLFGTLPNSILLPIPFGGHAIGNFLLQARLLQDLVRSVQRGKLEARQFRRHVRASRHLSGNYWHKIGLQLNRSRRHDAALACLARAWFLRPNDVVIGLDYANTLARNGNHVEAIAIFTALRRLSRQAPAPLRGLSVAWRNLGDTRRAVLYARGALKRRDSTDLRRILVVALIAADNHEEASTMIQALIAAEPAERANAVIAAQLGV